jgi:hypothetical protein
MYCSECGKPAVGKFCSNCGAPLAAAPDVAVAPATVPFPTPAERPATGSWDNEWRYAELIKFPEVRQIIDRHATMARTAISAAEFSKFADKLMNNPLPSDKLALFVQPIMGSFGIRTGKERIGMIEAPIGRGMLRVLCSLARHGQSLRGVQQESDGCVFQAVLPSDPMSLEGDLTISVRRRDVRTEITAATNIKGQIFDWGKSRRCLDLFFNDLQLEAA